MKSYKGFTITPKDLEVSESGSSFENCKFRPEPDGKQFDGINFSYALFKNCTYENCIFSNCNFSFAENMPPEEKCSFVIAGMGVKIPSCNRTLIVAKDSGIVITSRKEFLKSLQSP